MVYSPNKEILFLESTSNIDQDSESFFYYDIIDSFDGKNQFRGLENSENLRPFNNKFSLNVKYNEPFYSKLNSITILSLEDQELINNVENLREKILNSKYFSKFLKRKFTKRFFLIMNWLRLNITDVRLRKIIINRLFMLLKIPSESNYVINPYGLEEFNFLNILDFNDMFKMPELSEYNNNVINLILRKQQEFKYLIYRELLKEILYYSNSGILYENNLKNIYNNLETKYLTDIYRIISFWNLIKKLPIDSFRGVSHLVSSKSKIKKYKNINNLENNINDTILLNFSDKKILLNLFDKKNKYFKLLYNVKYLNGWVKKKK